MANARMSGGTDRADLDRYIIISSDTHADPPTSGFRDYIASKYHDSFDEVLAEHEAARAKRPASPVEAFREATQMPQECAQFFSSHPFLLPGGAPGLSDPIRLADLDAQGIAGEVIYPNFDAPFGALGGGRKDLTGAEFYSPELTRAGCRAWNRWLADLCSQVPARRAGIAAIPIYDSEGAVDEIRWARENGLRGGILLPGQISGRSLYNDPLYEPVWAACEDYDMPLNVHVGNDLPDYGSAPGAFALGQTEMLFFARRALWFLMWGGVFERHPNLVFALAEQDCYWVPQTLKELETILDSKFAGPGLRERLSLRPREYWARQCYVSATVMTRVEAERRYEIGIGNIMWGSDYPHLESSWPYTQLVLRNTFHSIPADEVRLMVGENAARVYGFDLDRLAVVAASIGPTVTELARPLRRSEIPTDYIGEGFRRPVSHA